MKEITREEVLFFVSNPKYLEQLRRQALDLKKELYNWDEQHSSLTADIYETSQVGVHYDKTGGSHSGKKKDLGDLLLLTRKMIEEHREELAIRYRNVLEHMDQCHRLRLVYDTLDETSKEVLNRIYTKKEKWEWIEHKMQLSHRKLADIRKEAVLTMQIRYNSEYTNSQLAEWCASSPQMGIYRKYDCAKRNIEGQLSLINLMDGKEGEKK